MNTVNRMTDSRLEGLPKSITYNEGGDILSIVCVLPFDDGSYTTFTQTYTYGENTLDISAWVGVFTPTP